MKFEYEGTSYLIEFERQSKVPESSLWGITRRYTTARVFKVTGPGKTDKQVLREYTVGCSHRDQFNYEEGRKYALTLALYDAPTMNDGEPVYGFNRLSKEFRTAVWAAYFNRYETSARPTQAERTNMEQMILP